MKKQSNLGDWGKLSRDEISDVDPRVCTVVGGYSILVYKSVGIWFIDN